MKRIAFLFFIAALGGILFGYDTAVISGTIAAVLHPANGESWNGVVGMVYECWNFEMVCTVESMREGEG